MPLVKLASLADLPETGSVAVAVAGRSVLVCRSSAGVFAVQNQCSHALSPLEGGKVRGPHIFCPLHGVRFDLRDGAPSGALTKAPITVYPVTLEGDDVLADLPG
jgi:3-phenylpropionate/trans-cinnamate dioxygenase ferredoxin component